MENILSDIEPEEIPASQGQRYVSNLIDGITNIAIFVAAFFLVPDEFLLKFANTNIVYRMLLLVAVSFCFRYISILLFGKSLGMLLAGLKYLNKDLQPLTASQKLIAAFLNKMNGINYYKKS